MTNTFTIFSNGLEPTCSVIEPGLTLAQHLYMEGLFAGRAVCSGAGRCGLCQVRYAGQAPEPQPVERSRIPLGRLDDGWRLSCRRPPAPGDAVETAVKARAPKYVAPGRVCPDATLGIDLGTTSIYWRHCHGDVTLEGRFPNPQLGAGLEVMSRLALAANPRGAARLRRDIAEAVLSIVSELDCLPGRVCLAGNTCMTYLALGMDASGLAAAPYRVDWPGGGSAGLDAALPEVYIPPLLAPFVGGDVSAGLAALNFSDNPPRPPYLLADLGTNGEFALALPDGTFLVASVPMGPALEGVGMARGMVAGPGAAVAFDASMAGLSPILYENGMGPAKGISGTGYLSLAARLVSLGAMEASGRFAPGVSTPLAARALSSLAQREGEPSLDVGGALVFASDIEALLKVKAAFCVAARLLLKEAEMDFAGLGEVLLAGAFGEHVRIADLETLGFFPPGGARRVRAVGNTSLEGACLAAGRDDVRDWLSGLPARTRPVEVVSMPDFQNQFIASMRFSHV